MVLFSSMKVFADYLNKVFAECEDYTYVDWAEIERIANANGWTLAKEEGFYIDGDHEGIRDNDGFAEYYQW